MCGVAWDRGRGSFPPSFSPPAHGLDKMVRWLPRCRSRDARVVLLALRREEAVLQRQFGGVLEEAGQRQGGRRCLFGGQVRCAHGGVPRGLEDEAADGFSVAWLHDDAARLAVHEHLAGRQLACSVEFVEVHKQVHDFVLVAADGAAGCEGVAAVVVFGVRRHTRRVASAPPPLLIAAHALLRFPDLPLPRLLLLLRHPVQLEELRPDDRRRQSQDEHRRDHRKRRHHLPLRRRGHDVAVAHCCQRHHAPPEGVRDGLKGVQTCSVSGHLTPGDPFVPRLVPYGRAALRDEEPGGPHVDGGCDEHEAHLQLGAGRLQRLDQDVQPAVHAVHLHHTHDAKDTEDGQLQLPSVHARQQQLDVERQHGEDVRDVQRLREEVPSVPLPPRRTREPEQHLHREEDGEEDLEASPRMLVRNRRVVVRRHGLNAQHRLARQHHGEHGHHHQPRPDPAVRRVIILRIVQEELARLPPPQLAVVVLRLTALRLQLVFLRRHKLAGVLRRAGVLRCVLRSRLRRSHADPQAETEPCGIRRPVVVVRRCAAHAASARVAARRVVVVAQPVLAQVQRQPLAGPPRGRERREGQRSRLRAGSRVAVAAAAAAVVAAAAALSDVGVC
eukprot:Rhum_TRINITY_DN14262_c5_g1::Rhum_TRINITY_DN14262_c5_g1_i1::g.73759::m.73759